MNKDSLLKEQEILVNECNFLAIAEKNAVGWAKYEVSKKFVDVAYQLLLLQRKLETIV